MVESLMDIFSAMEVGFHALGILLAAAVIFTLLRKPDAIISRFYRLAEYLTRDRL